MRFSSFFSKCIKSLAFFTLCSSSVFSNKILSVQLSNLTFDCDNIGLNHRVLLREPFYIENKSNTSIDIYAYHSNYTFSIVNGYTWIPVSNYTYNNISSLRIFNMDYGQFGIRPWQYNMKLDIQNKILYLSANNFTKYDQKILNVIYYYNENNTRIAACKKNKSIVTIPVYSEISNISETVEIVEDPPYFFPDRPMPVKPNVTTLVNTTIKIYPELNNTIPVEGISQNVFGTVLNKIEFWGLIAGISISLLFLLSMIILVKRERRLKEKDTIQNIITPIDTYNTEV